MRLCCLRSYGYRRSERTPRLPNSILTRIVSYSAPATITKMSATGRLNALSNMGFWIRLTVEETKVVSAIVGRCLDKCVGAAVWFLHHHHPLLPRKVRRLDRRGGQRGGQHRCPPNSRLLHQRRDLPLSQPSGQHRFPPNNQ